MNRRDEKIYIRMLIFGNFILSKFLRILIFSLSDFWDYQTFQIFWIWKLLTFLSFFLFQIFVIFAVFEIFVIINNIFYFIEIFDIYVNFEILGIFQRSRFSKLLGFLGLQKFWILKLLRILSFLENLDLRDFWNVCDYK